MSESLITQCPHCQTRFRVNQTQLDAAKGQVRCGSCLMVFNALQHIFSKPTITEPQKPQAEPQPVPQPTVSTVPRAHNKPDDGTLWIHDDLDLDSLNLDEELAKMDELESNNQPPQPPANRDKDHSDERWAEALLREANGGPSAAATEPPQIERQEAQPSKPLAAAIEHLSVQREDAINSPVVPVNKNRSEPALGDDSLHELQDEPLQLDWQRPRRRWGRQVLWLLLISLGIGGLAGQYTLYHFEELARRDEYRPWFAQLCPMFGCRLPSKVDVEQIRSSNLVVRSHSEFNGALSVDAIIYNRANFSQPFPLLEMQFADLNGKLIASRRFKPSEYLSGELAGQRDMPPQTPIHIALEILDPGPQAENYSLIFHSPE